jgi:hypothetical protein
MNPVPPNIESNTTSGCDKVISSTCVSWQGGDIDCLTICSGDTLTEVINKLGQVACTALTVATYNTTGISEAPPGSYEELVQLIIDTLVQQGVDIENVECDCESYVAPLATIPQCVKDSCESCISWEYPIPTAITHIGNYLCDFSASITSQISNLELEISQWARENDAAIAAAQKAQAEAQAAWQYALNHTVGTSLTGPTIGATVSVSTAIAYFEARVYEQQTVVGHWKNLIAAIALQDSGLLNKQQLNNPGNLMLSLTGWSPSPTTVAHTISNLWLTLQDLRSAYEAAHATTAVPCALVSACNVVINSITTTQVSLSWDAHGQTTIESEVDYQVNIYAYDGFTAVGPALVSSTAPSTSITLTTSSLDPSKEYVVEVISNYNCGTATPTQIVGSVVACAVTLKVNVESRSVSSSAELCNGGGYNKLTREIRVTLTTAAGTTVVNNTTGEPIISRLKYRVQDPLVANDVYEEFDFTIPENQSSSEWVPYVSYDQVFTDPACEDINRAEAPAAIEILANAKCYIDAGVITFIP